MKKYLFLATIILQTTFLFGQNTQWGSWTPVSCFSSLSTSILGNGYIPSINVYSWQVRIKSSYSKKVTFNMTWIVGGERLSIGEVTLSPGESYGHTPRYFKSSSNNINVEIDKVCFEGQDCYKNGYADCNGNQILITTSNSSSSSSTQSNNLDAYNRDNQIAQQQIQKENEEIQRKNQENANRVQNYNNAINAGVAAHNSGNYSEAKNQFTIAINNSNTQQDRNNAQEYYNKSVDSEKSQAKIKAVRDFSQTSIKAIDVYQKAKAAQDERKRLFKQIDDDAAAQELKRKQDANEERSQLMINADNGDKEAQETLAIRYFNEGNYSNAAYWYKQRFNNSSNKLNEYYLIQYLLSAALNKDKGKIVDVFLIEDDSSYQNLISNYKGYFLKKKIIYLQAQVLLNCNKYFKDILVCDSSALQDGVNKLKSISNEKTISCNAEEVQAKVLIAYYKVTGEFQNFGIQKNVNEGINELLEYTKATCPTATPNYVLESVRDANFYLGLIYRNGVSEIIKDEKKSYAFFSKAIVNFNNSDSPKDWTYNTDGLWFSSSFKAYGYLADMLGKGLGTKKDKETSKKMKFRLFDYLRLLTDEERINFLTENCWILKSGCPYKP